MANYIKVRPYVAKRLGVLETRYHYADGNVQLFDKDLAGVDKGWVFRKEDTVARIGGLMMDPYRNREEQMKTAEECEKLPVPTDSVWMSGEDEASLEQSDSEDNGSEDVDNGNGPDSGEIPDGDSDSGSGEDEEGGDV
ncbi:MAG: hypothetical protein HDS35_00045 [Bacteroides sp.]|nr:hypothetical protein [Bacteroides sp.]